MSTEGGGVRLNPRLLSQSESVLESDFSDSIIVSYLLDTGV